MRDNMKFRIGHSTDIHQLVPNRRFILGGITIDYEKGLLGHSDADCLLHAVTEAMIGALGLGDIGTHFPDTDPIYKDIDSQVLLAKAYELIIVNGYEINNLDCTIFAENPKMAPYIPKMKQNIAQILKTDVNNVNIKATRGEKLGFIGHGEGIMCEVVVLLIKS
jgi:2-C-methyl-D-erythritol 2,4-cyclodiphosphate synthase